MAAKRKTSPGSATAPRSLALRVVARLGEIARRSDVFVEGATDFGGAPGKWKAHLPQDMLDFYQELVGGLSHRWRFTNEANFHGPLLLSLAGDGKSLVNPHTQNTETKLMTAAKFPGGLKAPGGKPWDASDTIVFFAGELSSAGMFVCAHQGTHEFFSWDADGETRSLGTSFTALIEAGLATGFAQGWNHGDFDAPNVVTRLNEPVPPRETFEVVVEASELLTRAQYRAALGRMLTAYDFNAAMEALGQPPEPRTEDENAAAQVEARGQRFAAAVASAELVGTAAKKLASVLRVDAKRKQALAEHLHWDDRGARQVTFTLKALPGNEQLPFAAEPDTTVRVLFERSEFGVKPPCDPDIIRYAYPPKFRVYTKSFVMLESLTAWDEPSGARYRIYLDPDAAVQPGTFRSTALPSVQLFTRR